VRADEQRLHHHARPPLPSSARAGTLELYREDGRTVYRVVLPVIAPEVREAVMAAMKPHLPGGTDATAPPAPPPDVNAPLELEPAVSGATLATCRAALSHARGHMHGTVEPVIRDLNALPGAPAPAAESVASRRVAFEVSPSGAIGSPLAEGAHLLGTPAVLAAVPISRGATTDSTAAAGSPIAPNRALLPARRKPELPPLGLHLLCADDERSNQLVLKRMLGQIGCTCTIVSEGDELIAELRRVGQLPRDEGAGGAGGGAAGVGGGVPPPPAGVRRYDAVLCDIIMTRTNGLDTCVKLREAHGVTMPIIAASGNRPDPDFFGPHRFNGQLEKPFSAATIHEALLAHVPGARAALMERLAGSAEAPPGSDTTSSGAGSPASARGALEAGGVVTAPGGVTSGIESTSAAGPSGWAVGGPVPAALPAAGTGLAGANDGVKAAAAAADHVALEFPVAGLG
jgi:CheY-like chemotaxis protein